jgi:hypothetical protein
LLPAPESSCLPGTDQPEYIRGSGGDGVGLGALLGGAVAPRGGNAAELVSMSGLDVVDAIADHPCRFAIERVLTHQTGQEIDLAVAGVLGFVAVDGREKARELEEIENAHGEVALLRGADKEREGLGVKLSEHFADAGEDGVVPPAFEVVTGAIVAGEFDTGGVGCVGQDFGGPFFYGRTDKAFEWALIAEVAGVENFTQAGDDAGHGVGEGSIKVEDEGGLGEEHGLSFAELGWGRLDGRGEYYFTSVPPAFSGL